MSRLSGHEASITARTAGLFLCTVIFVGRDGLSVRTSNSQSREPEFESS